MAVFTRKAVFIHIPKTGGTWVKAALERSDLVEDYADDYHATLAKVANDTRAQGKLIFAFVRHPVEWTRSYWAYRKETRKFNEAFDPKIWAEEFDVFCRRTITGAPGGLCNQHFSRYIGTRAERRIHPQVIVGHQENLAEDLITILSLAGEEFDPDRIRETPREREGAAHMKRRAVVTDRIRELIIGSNWWFCHDHYSGQFAIDKMSLTG